MVGAGGGCYSVQLQDHDPWEQKEGEATEIGRMYWQYKKRKVKKGQFEDWGPWRGREKRNVQAT